MTKAVLHEISYKLYHQIDAYHFVSPFMCRVFTPLMLQMMEEEENCQHSVGSEVADAETLQGET